jgi:hypothetical protein
MNLHELAGGHEREREVGEQSERGLLGLTVKVGSSAATEVADSAADDEELSASSAKTPRDRAAAAQTMVAWVNLMVKA